MTHTYKVTGMTCGSCEAKVKSSLLMVPHITSAEVSKDEQTATLSMDKHVSLDTLQKALDKKYSITATEHSETAEQAKSWLATYKPVLLLFFYISVVSIIAATQGSSFNWMTGMNVFMGTFFLSFSFFKLLDISAFADSYSMYDIIAKKFKAWGFIYPFVELGLGLSFLMNAMPLVTNIVTLVVMGISIIGVLQSVFNKRKIKCACLGAVFNLPMSTVTIIEDGLMIAMSGVMLWTIL